MDDDLPLSILKELIRIPSQNPMGHSRQGPHWNEHALSQWLCRFFARHNVPHRYDEIEPNRGNVVAWLSGNPDRSTVLLDAHQDTVPVEGMTIDPFVPRVEGGRVFGRGACDVKGAMASILAAAVRLTRVPEDQRGNLIVSLTCDEELNQIGAADLVRRFDADNVSIPAKPDFAIISEPTELDVVVAHKGVVRWKIVTEGCAAHSSKPERGVNAIYSMSRIVTALDELAGKLNASASGFASKSSEHPLCGRPTLSVGTIGGGKSVNIVPDRCEIEIDRRVIPGETVESVLQQVRDQIGDSTNVEFEMLPPFTICEPLRDDGNEMLAEQLTKSVAPIVGRCKTIGVPYGTHAPQFANAGIPTVVFGPGSIDQAHTKDEWISIEQLDQSTEILIDFVTRIGVA